MNPPANLPARRAKGRQRQPGSMNGTERRYAEILEARRIAGEILWWKFEAIALRLAEPKCFFHPDFMVMAADGTLEIHEVKGAFTARMDDGGIIKLKVAAGTFPFVFRKCTWAKGEWKIEEVGASAARAEKPAMPAAAERKEKPAPRRVASNRYNGGPIPAGMAVLGDRLVPASEALALINKKAS